MKVPLDDLDAVMAAIASRLTGPLPGGEAHLRMAPRPRRFWSPGVVPNDARPAAALVLLYPGNLAAQLALTVRGRELPIHRGQVSFPGGAVDPEESLEAAALREAREEIGVDGRTVRILGRLSSLHIPVSGYALHPIVGVTLARPTFEPSPREVERVVEASLVQLADPVRLELETWEREGHAYEVPLFRIAGEVVWGATAMILAELLEVLGAPPDPWRDRPGTTTV